MKNHLLLILLAFSCSVGSINAQQLDGEYYGEMTFLNEAYYIRLQPKEGQLLFRLPYEDGEAQYPINLNANEAESVSFEITRFDEVFQFSGQWENPKKLVGKVSAREIQGDFVLHQRQSLAEDQWPLYLGTYQLTSGLIIKVWRAFNSLEVHSPLSQQTYLLRYEREGVLFTNSGENFHFSNRQNGRYQQLEWSDKSGNKLTAQRIEAYTQRDVVIYTRKDTIAGTLFVPNKGGKHPACLITPGAGRIDRTNNFLEAEIFSSYGIATLVVDKPGTGESSGDIWSNSFIDKQNLAIDLVHWMQEQPEIDPSRIGLWGASQGSRIAVMAAAELPETAFLVLAAHPIETMMNTQLYAIEQHLRGQFYPEIIISQATDIWRRFYHQISEEKIDANLLVEARALQKDYPDIYIPALPNIELPAAPHPVEIYSDPIDYLDNIKCPILSINGVLDERVPVQMSVKRLKEALQKQGHQDYTEIWFPEANHSFIIPGYRIAPGLFMKQVNWLRKRLFNS